MFDVLGVQGRDLGSGMVAHSASLRDYTQRIKAGSLAVPRADQRDGSTTFGLPIAHDTDIRGESK